jgi:hypothetical protein
VEKLISNAGRVPQEQRDTSQERESVGARPTSPTLVRLLCNIFPYKEIGWKEIGEVFYRWTLLRTPWFKVCLHYLQAEHWAPYCHDHPWDFWAIILKNGYWEKLDYEQSKRLRNHGQHCGENVYWRRPGSMLRRPAETKHSVVTQVGKPSWSLVIMGNKRREWDKNAACE